VRNNALLPYKRRRVHLDIVDISNPGAPFVKTAWVSQHLEDSHNDFNPSVAGWGSGGVGFFWYRQNNSDPCDTVVTGAVDTDRGDMVMYSTGAISDSFASMKFPGTGGLGDYSASLEGIAAGDLFVTWAEPRAWSAPVQQCQSCKGTVYDKVIMGALVIP
jgi:hypothetical protein